MRIRKINNKEMPEALDLVWNVFLKSEAPDYTESGVKEFKKTIDNNAWINEREFLGAFEKEKIIGLIATYNRNHISLFFVREEYQKKGIGRELFNYVLNLNSDDFFTVNSSPYAYRFYEHLGFVDTVDSIQEVNGLKFYPMKKLI